MGEGQVPGLGAPGGQSELRQPVDDGLALGVGLQKIRDGRI